MKNEHLIALGALLSMTMACTGQVAPSTGTDGKQPSGVNAPTDQPASDAAAAQAPDSGDAGPAAIPGCTPIPPSVALGNPATGYCVALGYQVQGEQCAFPDGTSCDQWSFYRGECGQVHSFCNLHGGSVANKTEDMGTWTASYALCTFPGGKQCQEDAFARSCGCE